MVTSVLSSTQQFKGMNMHYCLCQILSRLNGPQHTHFHGLYVEGIQYAPYFYNTAISYTVFNPLLAMGDYSSTDMLISIFNKQKLQNIISWSSVDSFWWSLHQNSQESIYLPFRNYMLILWLDQQQKISIFNDMHSYANEVKLQQILNFQIVSIYIFKWHIIFFKSKAFSHRITTCKSPICNLFFVSQHTTHF